MVTIAMTGAACPQWVAVACSIRRLMQRASLLLACCLGLVACGGGGGGSAVDAPPTTPPLAVVITVQPADRSTVEGGAVSFVAAANNASAWQWQSSSDGGLNWADIAAATAASYTTPATTMAMNSHQFRVAVRGVAGDLLTSSPATLVVTPLLQAAVITEQPQPQSLVAGVGASFSVTATGSALAYTWQVSHDGLDWSNLPVTSLPTLTLASTLLADNGKRYRVQVGNSLGMVVSAPALLTVTAAAAAPAFSASPANQAVAAGATAAFSVQVLGTPTPALRWQQSDDNGLTWADLPGATSSTLTLASVSLVADGRRLRVLASNSAGSAISGVALLTVAALPQVPVFTLSPIGATVSPGAALSMAARASGVPAPSLQWQTAPAGSAVFTGINGVTGESYTTPALDLSDSGRRWRVLASNSAGMATSSVAMASVGTAPTVRIVAPVQRNVEVLAGSRLTITTQAEGVPAPSFQWFQSKGSGPLTVVPGEASGSFTTPVIALGEVWSFLVQVQNGINIASARVGVEGLAPYEPSVPAVANDAVLTGSAATLVADVRPGLPVATLQWQSSSDSGATWSNLAGATAATLTLATTTAADNGRQFRLVASNSAGTVTSEAATLTVSAEPVGPAFSPFYGQIPASVVQTAGSLLSWGGSYDANRVLGVPKPTMSEYTSADGGVSWQLLIPFTSQAWSAADDGRLWRRVISNSAGTVSSLPVRRHITTDSASEVTWQAWPDDVTVQAGSLVQFSARGHIAGVLSTDQRYEWQVSSDGGLSWAAVTAQAGGYIGPDALQTAPVSAQDYGKLFRMRVSGAGKSYISGAARLTVTAAAQPMLAVLAGNAGGLGTRDGPAADARLRYPQALARDAAGNFYFLDPSTREGPRVRRLTPQGEVHTEWLAGWGLNSHAAGGTATLIVPGALAAAADGTLYIADRTRIWRRAPNSSAELLAGGGILGDGTGAAAGFASISSLALGADGTLYVSEGSTSLAGAVIGGSSQTRHCVRKVGTSGATRGVVTTLAGPCASGGVGLSGAVDGSGAIARFNDPGGLAVDSDGTVYVADSSNRRIRVITPAGEVSTLTGQASPPFPSPVASSGGTLASAQFFFPVSVAIVAPGVLAVADGGTVLAVLPAQDRVVVWAGSGFKGSSDGVGLAASFSTVAALVADGAGGVMVADGGLVRMTAVSPTQNAGLLHDPNAGNGLLRQVAADGTVTTRAGRTARVGADNGSGSAATFNRPFGVVADSAGNVYVADTGNHVIRRIDRFGLVSTLAGQAGVPGAADGTGSVARFKEPRALALAADGSLWVADHGNHLLRRVAANGAVSTVAGSAGVQGSADGSGSVARFSFPAGVAVLPGGDVAVADSAGLRRVKPDGSTRTVSPGSLRPLVAVAADAAGVVYVANPRAVFKVSSTGAVMPLVGSLFANSFHGDGTPGTGNFADITALALDSSGRLLVADGLAQTVRRVETDGRVATVLGVSDHDLWQLRSGGWLVSVGGVRLSNPRLGYAAGVAVLPDGRLAVTSENGVFVATVP